MKTINGQLLKQMLISGGNNLYNHYPEVDVHLYYIDIYQNNVILSSIISRLTKTLPYCESEVVSDSL